MRRAGPRVAEASRLSTASVEPSGRTPPRPPRPAEGPLLIPVPGVAPTHAGATGPAWVKAPPPAYHLGEVAHLVEPVEVHAALVQAPSPATAPVRCPKCRGRFDWTLERPATVTCPHCGTKGMLKGSALKP
jgi:DNA-directed RNA polymerase subunit RPC12/RpoP